MAVLAERMRGRRNFSLFAGLAAVVALVADAVPAGAQMTVIDSGPAVLGPGAGGSTGNNGVLENLEPSPEVPAVPGTTNRQSDSGQLLVTPSGRLMFPPRRAPRRRLATETAAAPKPPQEPELTSRLVVPPVPQSSQPIPPAPVGPAVEAPMAAAEPIAPPPAPMTPKPRVAAQPEPAPPDAAVPAPAPAPVTPPVTSPVAPPAPSTLAEELVRNPAPAAPSQNSVATARSAPPPEPSVRPAAPPLELVAPAPTSAKTEPPPPPAKSLTSKPAIEPQTAALPSAPALAEQIRVLFPDGSIELSDDARRRLSAVATALGDNTTIRVQILAYANSNADGASRARRLSLSRALAVRAYLIERGVRSTRMNVRALGDKFGDGPADRVDILPEAAN